MSAIETPHAGIRIPRPPVLHQSLIITLFGLYRRTSATAVPVAALVSLLGDLGYDGPGVRSAVSRLKNKGILTSASADGVAAYYLAESVRATFDEGDERIFAATPPRPLNDWALVLFSVPESRRSLRHQLRKLLRSQGFGTVASGVSIGAGHLMEQAREKLTRSGLEEYVQFFRGEYSFSGDVRDQVAQWWDLDAVDASMREFLDLYDDAVDQWSGLLTDNPNAGSDPTGEIARQAFQYYVPMLTMWRRLPYEDPNLPAEYLPAGWKEPSARAAFVGTHQLIEPLATRYFTQTVSAHLPSGF